jgi:hypothetical protein
MQTPGFSKAEAAKVSKRTLLKPGKHPGRIDEAVEKDDRHGKPMIELLVTVRDRQLRDWLTSSEWGALKLLSCCEACGPEVLARYNEKEIGASDFPGNDVIVTIEIEKGKRGYPDQNRIVSYAAPAASGVVPLVRSAG